MAESLQVGIALLAVLAAVAVTAHKLALPAPILFVVAGLVLAFVPGVPDIHLEPELVLLLFLPLIVYAAGVQTSWRGFRDNLHAIGLLAIGGVAFSACAVAAAGHWLLGLSWPVAFVLGAIVSPPDVVAAEAISSRLAVPRRILAILEGEGLVNDASALVLYRFALLAATAGAFSLWKAGAVFLAILVGESLFGLAVAWGATRLRRWVDEPRAEIAISLLTPFVAYWVPEHLGGSGVLATVAAGLYVSWNSPQLVPSATRLQGDIFWNLITYLVEGLLFLLIGSQAKTAITGLDLPWPTLLLDAALILAVVILARFAWVFPAAYLPGLIPWPPRERAAPPPWQEPFLIAFTGMRGVVSLAAALAIPLTVAGGEAFPERDLVLFLTFAVILGTLLGLGPLLPWLIRWLGLIDPAREERQEENRRELEARIAALQAGSERLDSLAGEENVPDEVAQALRARQEHRIRHLERYLDAEGEGHDVSSLAERVEGEVLAAERERLEALRQEGSINDAARRRIEGELDLEETRLQRSVRGRKEE